MDRFILDFDEDIEKQCGEIFLSTKGRLSIHCTLCEEAYCGFDSYQTHLSDVHLFQNNSIVQNSFKIEMDEADADAEALETGTKVQDDFNYLDDFHSHMETKDTTIDIQIEINKDESKDVSKTSNLDDATAPKQRRIFLAAGKKTQKPTKESQKQTEPLITELNLPTVVRDVVKRKVYIAKVIPEEEKKHKCPICGIGFREKGNMRHHLRRHSDQRNHACPECDKRFYSSTELNTHIKSHTREKPLLCNICGEKFTTKSTLGGHLKRHKEQKDYHCQHPGCTKSFYTATYLKNHMLSHSNERRVRCPVCNAGFKQRTAFKNHYKLHENKLEYKCTICDSEFNQKAGLFSHMKSVHKSV